MHKESPHKRSSTAGIALERCPFSCLEIVDTSIHLVQCDVTAQRDIRYAACVSGSDHALTSASRDSA